jgi:AcrR family transcriptional regulator
MREMAKTIEVSHTAAYRHFADKRALLDAVAVQGFISLRECCEQASAGEELAPRDRLGYCGRAYVRFALDNPMLLDYMFSAAARKGSSAELKESGSALFALLQKLVANGQSQGAFRDGDAQALAQACWAMVHGLSTLLSSRRMTTKGSNTEDRVTMASASLDVFLDGIERLPSTNGRPA